MNSWKRAAPALAAIAIAGCGSSGGSDTGSADSSSSTAAKSRASVTIKSYMFGPKDVTVKTGAKVSFRNEDSSPHTATAKNRSFDTGTLDKGQAKTVTLKKAGTYNYFCELHPYMTAKITVVGGS